MGTRSETYIYDNYKGKKILLVNMYRQMDGYPSGHGQDLITYLMNKKIINGIGQGCSLDNSFNGASCMAAAIISHFKTEIGGIYISYPQDKPDGMLDYIYKVYPQDQEIMVECHQVSGGFDNNPVKLKCLFKDTANNLANVNMTELEEAS